MVYGEGGVSGRFETVNALGRGWLNGDVVRARHDTLG
jgi:hypothetical protein